MEIYIDIHRAIGAEGKAIIYAPEIHWTIDEKDTITTEGMSIIQARLQHEIEEAFKSARRA